MSTIQSQSGRAAAIAYRIASSKGQSSQKAYKKHGISQFVSRARMMGPDISTRELAKQVRNERCVRGKICATTPNVSKRKIKSQIANKDSSQTFSGQSVSETTPMQLTAKLVGNYKKSCKIVSGTEYLGAEEFKNYSSQPQSRANQAGFSCTNKKQIISGATIGQDKNTTGDTIGQRALVTGTECLPAEQIQDFCQFKTSKNTNKNTTKVTGGEDDFRKLVTGTNYQKSREIKNIDNANPVVKTAAKELIYGDNNDQIITGDCSGGNGDITGIGLGDCQLITGTPYLRTEQVTKCLVEQKSAIDKRLCSKSVTQVSASQAEPRELIGAQKSEHSVVITDAYQPAQPGDVDYPNAIASNQSSAIIQENNSSKITGKGWDKGSKVTGTEGMWAAQRNTSLKGNNIQTPLSARQFRPENTEVVPMSPITGSSGNTDTGAKVTLSGGARA